MGFGRIYFSSVKLNFLVGNYTGSAAKTFGGQIAL